MGLLFFFLTWLVVWTSCSTVYKKPQGFNSDTQSITHLAWDSRIQECISRSLAHAHENLAHFCKSTAWDENVTKISKWRTAQKRWQKLNQNQVNPKWKIDLKRASQWLLTLLQEYLPVLHYRNRLFRRNGQPNIKKFFTIGIFLKNNIAKINTLLKMELWAQKFPQNAGNLPLVQAPGTPSLTHHFKTFTKECLSIRSSCQNHECHNVYNLCLIYN